MTEIISLDIDGKVEHGHDHEMFAEMVIQFHNNLVKFWRECGKVTIFRELTDAEKIESLICGTLTAVIEIAFQGISNSDDRDSFMNYLRDSALAYSRKMVEKAEHSNDDNQ